jgi:ABC-type nitrate/sulfonate/bicarbonate transport system substrate-binding protein
VYKSLRPRRLFQLCVLAAVLVVAPLLSGCGSSGGGSAATATPGGTVTSVALGDPGQSATLWPEYVAQEEGFFKKNGLEVKFVGTGSSSAVPQSMLAGAVDLGSAGIVDFVRAINGGGALHLISAGVNQPIYGVVARKDITSWSQLNGQRVIVGGQSDITAYYFKVAAKANGLDPSSVNLTYAGATSARYAALEGGSVAAAMLASPFDASAEQTGGVNLGNAAKYLPNSPFTAYAATDSWAKKNPVALAAFKRAIADAMTWLNDPANKQDAEKILIQETSTTQDAAAASYQSLITDLRVFPNSGALSADALGQLLEGLVNDKFLPPTTNTNPNQYLHVATNGK